MDRRRIEAWAIQVVEQCVAKSRVEDDRVECKGEWPDPDKTVRQLAGHCNAARSEDVLWIFGLDDAQGKVVPLDGTDPASWWSQVESRFADGVAPDALFLSVPTAHGTVMALALRTDRSPYLIKTVGVGGGVESEIPWRSGTRTRTAKRSELLSLLIQAAEAPSITLFDLTLVARHVPAAKPDRRGDGSTGTEHIEWDLVGRAFFEPSRSGRQVMLPAHRWGLDLQISKEIWHLAPEFSEGLVSGGPLGSKREAPYPDGVLVRTSGLYVAGPDTLTIRSVGRAAITSRQAILTAASVGLRLRMPLSGSDRVASFDCRLVWRSGEEAPNAHDSRSVVGRWTPDTEAPDPVDSPR